MNEYEQIKFFDVPPIDKCPKTIKAQFRQLAGYDQNHICKNCKYHIDEFYRNKHYHKCRKMGISNSAATDIRLKDIACRLFEEAEKC